jgi:hypothetical protein
MGDHDDLIPGVDDLLERHFEFFPGARPLLEVVSHRIRAVLRCLIDRVITTSGSKIASASARPPTPYFSYSKARRAISTFSCDIARSVSRVGARRSLDEGERERRAKQKRPQS